MSDRPTGSDRRNTESSFGGRVRRYAQVSGTFGAAAARFAGRRMTGSSNDLAQAGELREALGGLKGPLMKVAQMMATIPEALPAEYAAELAQLQSNAPPMGKPFVRRRMVAELGPDWEANFAHFPLESSAAASLGQVHKATLKDGRTVACKLQYPNIAAAVDADLSQLKLIFAIYRRYDKAINPDRIYEEIAARLHEELDYAHEARNMGLYDDILADRAEHPRADSRRRAVDRPALDDGLARRREAARLQGSRRRDPQRHRAEHVQGVVRALSTIMASFTATRISAITRCGRTWISTSSISAACASSRHPSSRV